MARPIIVLAIIFFAAACSAAPAPVSAPTKAPVSAPAKAPAKSPVLAPTPAAAAGPTAAHHHHGNGLGDVSGAVDAAPVGGPVPDGAFPDLTPAPAPANNAARGATTFVGAVVTAAVAGSFFF